MMRIHTKAFMISGGIVSGGAVLLGTLAGTAWGYAHEPLQLLTALYPGYSVSLVGSLIGSAYGFCSGAVACGLIGWLYNKLFVRI